MPRTIKHKAYSYTNKKGKTVHVVAHTETIKGVAKKAKPKRRKKARRKARAKLPTVD